MSNAQLTVAASAAATPVVWTVLGYQFEAGSMIAAVVACVVVRAYRGQRDRAHFSLSLDLPVSVLTLLFTAGCVIHFRPEPLYAIVWGTGLGSLGEMLIRFAERWVKRAGLLGEDPVPVPTTPPVPIAAPPASAGDEAAQHRALRTLDHLE